MASTRQIEANRLNARKSTGPKRTENSRRNALKDGMAGSGTVLPADLEANVERRMALWAASYQPRDDQEMMVLRFAVANSVRLEWSFREDTATRCRFAERARLCWDDDRRAEAAELGSKLAKDPLRYADQLRRTKHGCQWLRGRWDELGRILDDGGTWDERQRSQALDLLGVSHVVRTGRTPADAEAGEPEREFRRALVDRQCQSLDRASEGRLDDADAFERKLAEDGLAAGAMPELVRLLRYEARNSRHFYWALGQLKAKGMEQRALTRAAIRGTIATGSMVRFEDGEDDEPEDEETGHDEMAERREARLAAMFHDLMAEPRPEVVEPPAGKPAPAPVPKAPTAVATPAPPPVARAAAQVQPQVRPPVAFEAPRTEVPVQRETRRARKQREAREWSLKKQERKRQAALAT